MLALLLLAVIIGYYIAISGCITRLFKRLEYRGPDDPEPATLQEAPPPAPVTTQKGRRITIFYKQKKGSPEGPQRYICDMIRYEKGYLTLYLYNSLDEVEMNIKEVDQIIL